jgi:hypothetical protein
MPDTETAETAAAGARAGTGRGWLWLALLAAALAGLRGAALQWDHGLNSIDGALQTWFALDGFAEGRQLGTAFQSYLGITMILALLPAYIAFGQTLYASTLAASIMVVAGAFAMAASIAWLARAVPRRGRWVVAVLVICTFYTVLRIGAQAAGQPWPASFDPGVSLRPLRGFLPFFVLPVFVWALRRALRSGAALVPGAGLGLAAGAGLLWSNDAGIPLVLALGLGLVAGLAPRWTRLAAMLAGYAAGTALAAGALLLAVTHGAPRSWLAYNFRDVAGDQGWFFGPWGRETRILGPEDLPNLLTGGEPLTTLTLVVLAGCVLIAFVQRLRGRGAPVRRAALVFLGASLCGTALIPQLGGHIGPEYGGVTFVFGACAPLILFERRWLPLARPLLRISPRLWALTAGAAALLILAPDAARLASLAATTDRTVYSEAVGFHVTPAFADELAAMARLGAHWRAEGIPADRRLLSVYTSPLDIAAGVESPAPFGSLIHALGPVNRKRFTGLVESRAVAAVTTIAPDYSGWEGWIARAGAPFFRALLLNYTPVARTGQHILWLRGAAPAPPAPAACRAAPDGPATLTLTIAADRPGLAFVDVQRSGHATGSTALLTVTETSPDTRRRTEAERWGDFPRYGIANAPVLRLAAPVTPREATSLRLDILDSSRIGAASCSAAVWPMVDHAALPPLAEGIDAYLREAAR